MDKQKITLSRSRAHTVLHAVQGESNSQTFAFALTDSRGAAVQLTEEMSAAFYVNKNDSNTVQLAAEVDTDSQTVNVPLTLQATTAAGNHTCLLQVYTSDEDIWQGDITLSVTANPASKIPSRPEFQILTEIMQNAANIKQLSDYNLDVSKALNDVLDQYTETVSPETSGKISMSPYANQFGESDIAYDDNGNLLFVDCYNYGGTNTKYSLDDGKTWFDSPLTATPASGEDQATFTDCIGGDKFLCLSNDYILWVTVSTSVANPQGRCTYDHLLANPLKTTVQPTFIGGRCIKDDYWVLRNSTTKKAYPPAYFTGNGADYNTVTLPNAKMVATDIVFDPKNNIYYMVGTYDLFTDDGYKGWLLQSDDKTTWSTVKEWTNTAPCYYKMTLQDDILNIYGVNCAFGRRYNTGDGSFKAFTIAGASGIKSTVTTAFGALATNYDSIIYTKNGTDFDNVPLTFDDFEHATKAAAYGRKAVIVNGPYYAVYRVDFAGTTMLRSLEDADKLLADLQIAAGRRIVCTDTDPGENAESAESDGTIIFVFEGSAET